MTDDDHRAGASCSGRVSDARCASRRTVMRNRRQPALPTGTLLWLVAVVALLLVLLQHR